MREQHLRAFVERRPRRTRTSGLRLPSRPSRRPLPRRICVLVVHREKFTRRSNDFLAHHLEAAFDQRAGSAGVTTTGKLARKTIYIDIAGAAERNLHLVVSKVAEEQRQPRTAN